MSVELEGCLRSGTFASIVYGDQYAMVHRTDGTCFRLVLHERAPHQNHKRRRMEAVTELRLLVYSLRPLSVGGRLDIQPLAGDATFCVVLECAGGGNLRPIHGICGIATTTVVAAEGRLPSMAGGRGRLSVGSIAVLGGVLPVTRGAAVAQVAATCSGAGSLPQLGFRASARLLVALEGTGSLPSLAGWGSFQCREPRVPSPKRGKRFNRISGRARAKVGQKRKRKVAIGGRY